MAEKYKILLIDDDQDFCELVLTMLLRDTGYDLVVRNDLGDETQVVMAGEFDAILLDVNLPPLRGLETVEVACARAGVTPVIALADSNGSDFEVDAIRAGADSLLTKDHLTPKIIVAGIRRASARRQNVLAHYREERVLQTIQYTSAASVHAINHIALDQKSILQRLQKPGLLQWFKRLKTPKGRREAISSFIFWATQIGLLGAAIAGGLKGWAWILTLL